MPALEDDRLESFAWLIARVAEIRGHRERGGSDALEAIIGQLFDHASKLGASGDLASISQARLFLNDAARLKAQLPREHPPREAAIALQERDRRARLYA